MAQSLLGGFLRRESRLRTYLAGVRLRVVDPPPETPPRRRRLATLVFGLLEGFSTSETAFEHHARRFHARFGLALA